MPTFTDDELKELLMAQAKITALEVSNFCADLCDKNKGWMNIGDIIREQFNFEAHPPVEIKPTAKKSHLSIVK